MEHKHAFCKDCKPEIASEFARKRKLTATRKREENLKKYLTLNGYVGHGQHIKKQLIEFGYKEDVCECCGQLPFWKNKPLVLQLEHVNGDRRDFRIENLMILCPNCHSQTETYGGKNATWKIN